MKDDEIPYKLKSTLEAFKQRGSSILNIFVPNERVSNDVIRHARRMGLGARGVMTVSKVGTHWMLYGGDEPMHFVEVTQS